MGTEINPRPVRIFGLDVKHTLNEIDHTECFDCITMWHSLEHMKDRISLNVVGFTLTY